MIPSDVLTVCRSKASDCLSKYLSVTGIAFSLDTRNAGTYPTHIQICGKLSTYTTGLSHQSVQLSDKAIIPWKKLNQYDFKERMNVSILTLKTSVTRLKGTQTIYFRSQQEYTLSQPYFQNVLILDSTNDLMEFKIVFC